MNVKLIFMFAAAAAACVISVESERPPELERYCKHAISGAHANDPEKNCLTCCCAAGYNAYDAVHMERFEGCACLDIPEISAESECPSVQPEQVCEYVKTAKLELRRNLDCQFCCDEMGSKYYREIDLKPSSMWGCMCTNNKDLEGAKLACKSSNNLQ